MFERENYKLLFQLCSHEDKEAYLIKEAAGYDKGKKGKKSVFFFQNSTLLQVWAFDVFYLLDNTTCVGVFTLIKLVFET